MIELKQIPDEVVEAAARVLCRQDGRFPDAVVGPDGMRGFLAWESYKLSARSAIAAALNAWPGMVEKQANENLLLANLNPTIILPLTDEG